MVKVRVPTRSTAQRSGEINEFLVAPPRAEPFAGRAWEKPLATFLRRRFPDLILHVSEDLPFREPFEPAIVPLCGTAGDEDDGGWFLPITGQTRATMQSLAEAVGEFASGIEAPASPVA